MADLLEIRWHGRGGQGAKTAALLLADAAFNTGMYIQGFPEYGPERMGAPITAYNRISTKPITIHSNIYQPDYVAVVDEGLLEATEVTKGLKDGGGIIVNSPMQPEDIRPRLKGYKGRICTINANLISKEELGRIIPNTPILAAVISFTGLMDINQFINEMQSSLSHKFSNKPKVIDGNMRAIKRAASEVNIQ